MSNEAMETKERSRAMAQTKAGGPRGIRLKGDTLAIVQEAEQFGVNVSEMLNTVLDANQDTLRVMTGATGFVLPRQSPRRAIATASLKVFGVRWSWHCFRHLFATRCIQSGVDLPTVARWLGHKDGGALLAKTYFHLVDSHSREMAAKVRIAA